MNNIDEIKDIIVDVFKGRYKSDQLKVACKKYGMDIDDVYSKADKIKSGLNKLSDQDIEKIAAKIEIDFNDSDLIKALSPYLGDSNLDFSFISRNAVIMYLEQEQNMEGKVSLEKFIEKFLPGSGWIDPFSAVFNNHVPSKAEVLQYYVKKDKSMSYRDLLTDELKITYFPDHDS